MSWPITSREGSARAHGLATNASPAAPVISMNLKRLEYRAACGGSNLISKGGAILQSASARIHP